MVAFEDEKDHLTESYFCPLTKELFIDAVMTSDGNTFEKHAIEEWLKTSEVSPLTHEKLDSKFLMPNPIVQTHILDHYKKYLARKAIKTSSKLTEVEKPAEVKKEEHEVPKEVPKE